MTKQQCGDELMEVGWEEGFTCTRPAGHDGPHMMGDSPQGELKGTHQDGRPYHYAMAWAYDSKPQPALTDDDIRRHAAWLDGINESWARRSGE